MTKIMRCKRLLIICILIISAFSVSAIELQSVEAGTGNDLFSLAVNNNYDDQLSFNLYAGVDFDEFGLKLNLDSYTKRFTNRFDNLMLTAHKKFEVGAFEFTPCLGLSVHGNMQFQEAQNLLHRFMKIPEVIIDYDTEKELGFAFGANVAYRPRVTDNLKLAMIINSTNVAALYYSADMSANLEIASALSLGMGYRFFRATETSATLKDFEFYANGIESLLRFKTSFITFEHYAVLKKGFGFGSLGFDFYNLIKKMEINKDTDMYKSLITVKMAENFLFNAGNSMPHLRSMNLSYSINDSWSVFVDDTYMAGTDMIVPSDYIVTKNGTRNSRKLCFITAGATYKMRHSGFFNTSFSLGAGLGHSEHKKLDYAGQRPEIKNMTSSDSFIVNGRIDISVLPDWFIKVGESDLNLDLFTGLYCIPSHEKLTSVIQADGSDNHASLFIPYAGFGFSVNVAR